MNIKTTSTYHTTISDLTPTQLKVITAFIGSYNHNIRTGGFEFIYTDTKIELDYRGERTHEWLLELLAGVDNSIATDYSELVLDERIYGEERM